MRRRSGVGGGGGGSLAAAAAAWQAPQRYLFGKRGPVVPCAAWNGERHQKGKIWRFFGVFFSVYIQIIICLTNNMQTCICRFHMCKYGLQIKTRSFCMCICVSAQQNHVFRRKKSANSHFSAKKDGAKLDTVFCKRHRSKKITA